MLIARELVSLFLSNSFMHLEKHIRASGKWIKWKEVGEACICRSQERGNGLESSGHKYRIRRGHG